jgi:hypothetical protein
MYAKVESGSVTKFPYSFNDLRVDNSNVSFPATALQDADTRAAYNVEEVQDVAHANLPGYNYTLATPVFDGGVWKQVWTETAKNAADLEDSEITAVTMPEADGKNYALGTPALDGKVWKQTWVESDRSYTENRLAEYGDINEQLEYIVENGLDAFITKQEAVKTKWPKS